MRAGPQSLAQVSTLAELFAWRVHETPAAAAYREFNAKTGQWDTLTWADTADRVRRWTLAMAAQHLPHGARVALLLPNGVQAVCVDQAALALGCVPVPLHAIDNPGSIAYILADSEASLLVAHSERQWTSIAATGVPLPALKCVVITGDEPPAERRDDAIAVMPVDVWLATRIQGNDHPPAPPLEGDLAAIVYTSGTTGKPKGVMLTHANVVSNVKAVLRHVPTRADDLYLSFLPLSHTFERTAGYYLPMAAGSCVAFARSVPLLSQDLRSQRPTVLVSVPRIYERVHAQIGEMLAASTVKARLFRWAEAVGWRRFCAQQHLPLAAGEESAWAFADALVWPLLSLLVARPLQARFGGRLRVAVSGGAPLSRTVARTFLGLGLQVLQGYGMTETSPVVAANTPDHNDPTSVGTVLDGVQVRLGDNRELQVRGPGVMKGYWKRPEDTARAFTDDGWLRTGDQASLDDGRVRIRGRIKEIIVTSTGEKVSPSDLELAIANDPLFAQVFVVGENRPFIAAVVVVDPGQWKQLAASLKVDPDDAASLALPQVREAALARIERQVADFARYAVPRAVHLTLAPWTIENALMTPTLKLKRNNLMAAFQGEIEAMYRK
ncbi:MAG: long-chain fatty acid--CoA ligase [Rhizobacter sp.]|nr:long-chain fatty acid--CoA ligase [Rhizobacter sp.]